MLHASPLNLLVLSNAPQAQDAFLYAFQDHFSIVAAACTCQKHVTNVSQHGSMGKSDGAMRFSLSCQKVILYSESAKT